MNISLCTNYATEGDKTICLQPLTLYSATLLLIYSLQRHLTLHEHFSFKTHCDLSLRLSFLSSHDTVSVSQTPSAQLQ